MDINKVRGIYDIDDKKMLYIALKRVAKSGAYTRQQIRTLKGKINNGRYREVAKEMNRLVYFTEMLFE